jgi:hypothetical protein
MSHRWEDAILVGIIPREFMDASQVDPQNGIVPDSSRVIAESDRLIFISRESLPTDVRVKPPRYDIDYTAKAPPVEKRPKKSLLVCGFQQVWKDPERFAYRLYETGNALAAGSHIYFLNLMGTDEFLASMDEVGKHIGLEKNESLSDGKHRTVWIFEGRIQISFTEGDPANYDTLERVMKEQNGFDVSLVVPPLSTALSPQAQDTRLMTIMCTFRMICENNALPPIHVVGENKLESSSGLALRPKTDESIDETDFVNVQAIIARALCQSMAFPFMAPAVVQLFDSMEGTPSVYIVQASLFVPLDYEIVFSDLIEEVKEECKDHVCIGYRLMLVDQVKQILCPRLDESVRFQEHDCLVIMSRQQPGIKQGGNTGRGMELARKIEDAKDGLEVLNINSHADTDPFLLPTAINA